MSDMSNDDIDVTFDWWHGALCGVRGPISADEPKSGFYRWVWKQKNAMGVVAYWYDSHDGSLRCQVDGRDVDDLHARERWPHDSRRPISEEVFHAFRDTGKFPDVDDVVQVNPDEAEEIAPNVALAKLIGDLKTSADKYKEITSDESMVLAQSVRAELMEQSTKADKLRVAEKEPHLKAGREVDAKYQPMIKVADAAALTIRKALEAWNDHKLAQLRAAEKAAAAAVVGEMDAPAPVISNAPMPSTQIRGGGGRAASVAVKPRVTAVDLDKAFKQFRDRPEVLTLFMSLAQKEIDAGLPCEAATVEQKSSVR
jgi:hypothetical protein